jgi:hypothetical protein
MSQYPIVHATIKIHTNDAMDTRHAVANASK